MERCSRARRTSGVAGILVCVILMFCGVAHGTEWMALAGVEGTSDSSYIYLGTVAPLPGSQLGNGFVVRCWADRLTYEYESDNRDIEALAPGLEGSVGFQGSGRQGWMGVYGGIAYRHTDLSPDDTKAKARGHQARPKGQAEGALIVGTLRFHTNAAYTFGLRSYWVRSGCQRLVGNALWTGPEVTAQGDPDYFARKIGWAFSGISLINKAELSFSGGFGSVSDSSWRPYAGLHLSYLY